MANTIDSMLGLTPNYSDVLSPQQSEQMQKAALMRGGLGAIVSLLSNSGNQPRQVSTGQALGNALGAGFGGYQQSFDDSLKQMLISQKLSESQRKVKQQQEIERIRQSAISPQVSIAPGMSSADPFVARMMDENMSMGDLNLDSLARSGNFAVQGTGREMASPQVSSSMDMNKYVTGLINAGYIDEAKKYTPEYLTVGNSIYEKNIAGGLKPVINNNGQLTGEFGNYAKLLYGTDDVKQLPPRALQEITGYINKGKSLMGGINLDLGKEASNITDKTLLDLGKARITAQNTIALYKPEYLTRPFQLKMTALAEAEKINPNSLDSTQKQDLAQYSQFQQNAMGSLNEYINKITGAAIGADSEEARLRSAIPDPQKDSPTQFEAKMQDSIKLGRLFEARLSYVKKNGFKLTSISVDDMPSIMLKRESEIIKELNLDPKNIKDRGTVRDVLSQEFGLL